MKIKNFFKNNTRMTTENTLNDEIVNQTPIENNETDSDILDSTIEERVEEISKEEQLSQDLASEKDKFLRLFAEFENYKRRTARERIELFKTANQEVLLAMLPVLDDFDRALTEIKKTDDNILIQGVELIQEKLKTTLVSKGLEQVDVKVGDAFDADFAEAITQIPAPSAKMKGKIVDVIEKGYKLGDKIIRFPKVVIGQ
jgi:molecular chaperone GrpE